MLFRSIEDLNLIEQLSILNLRHIENRIGATYEMNEKKSKIDHIIVSNNLDTEKLILQKSISDHKILSVKIKNITEVQRNNIKLIGNPLYVPDRFGNTADGTALPYFLSGASDSIERDIMGFLLQIINKSYPNSKAFKDINYVEEGSAWKYIETNWSKWVATLSAEESGVGAQAGNNVFKSGVRQLISDQINKINTYSLFVKSQNREFFDKYRKIVGAFAKIGRAHV